MALSVLIGMLAGTWLAEYGDGKALATGCVSSTTCCSPRPPFWSAFSSTRSWCALPRLFGGAGAVALAFLAIPVVTRTTEDMLRLQPHALREAGMALGASKGHVIRSVIWRASRPGLVTGGLLGFARISGETAPLLFTSLGNPFLSLRIDEPVAALPTVIFQYALSAYDDWEALAWAGRC
jgi:phosphate transport system permease protein